MDAKFLPDADDRGASASRSNGEGARRSAAKFGFPRTARLLRRAEFDAVYQGGQRRASQQFAVFFRPNGLGHSRFGASVKRALGGSVVRNRIRRRLREILRLHRQEIAPGWDVVIHPRRSVATAALPALAAELLGVLRAALQTERPGPPETSGRA